MIFALHSANIILPLNAGTGRILPNVWGRGSTEHLKENWNMYLPKILDRDVASEEEKDAYEALEILDKAFRPSGPGSKSPAAFTLHEVSLRMYIYVSNLIIYLIN